MNHIMPPMPPIPPIPPIPPPGIPAGASSLISVITHSAVVNKLATPEASIRAFFKILNHSQSEKIVSSLFWYFSNSILFNNFRGIDDTSANHINKFICVSVVARLALHNSLDNWAAFNSSVISNSFTWFSKIRLIFCQGYFLVVSGSEFLHQIKCMVISRYRSWVVVVKDRYLGRFRLTSYAVFYRLSQSKLTGLWMNGSNLWLTE